MLEEVIDEILEDTGFRNFLKGNERVRIVNILRSSSRYVPSLSELNEAGVRTVYNLYRNFGGAARDLRNSYKKSGDRLTMLTSLVMDEEAISILLGYENMLYEHIRYLFMGGNFNRDAHDYYCKTFSFHALNLLNFSETIEDPNLYVFLHEKAITYLMEQEKREVGSGFAGATVFCYRDLARAYFGLFKVTEDKGILNKAKTYADKARRRTATVRFRLEEGTERILRSIEVAS